MGDKPDYQCYLQWLEEYASVSDGPVIGTTVRERRQN